MESHLIQVVTHDDAVSMLEYFDGLDDPRSSINRQHLLGDLIVISVCGVLAEDALGVVEEVPRTSPRYPVSRHDWSTAGGAAASRLSCVFRAMDCEPASTGRWWSHG